MTIIVRGRAGQQCLMPRLSWSQSTGPTWRSRAGTPKKLSQASKLAPTPNITSSAMLTEHFVASISAHTKPNTGVTKDAGIFFHEYQPLANQRHVFKKSATAPNCLAVSSSHIFAAQAEKAVVHVYSREKGNQEAIVPFPERIHSIALAAHDTVLLLGTASGRILGWEVSSILKNMPVLISSLTLHTDLLRPPRVHLFIPSPTRHLPRSRSLV